MPNGSGLFAILESDVDQGKSPLLEKKTLNNRNLVASRHIKREMPHFWLTCVCRSKTSLLNILPKSLYNLHVNKIVVVLAHRYFACKSYILRVWRQTTYFQHYFFLITPPPFLLGLNSVISLLPRRLCNSWTKVGSCLLFIHSVLSRIPDAYGLNLT